jgi:hypothetical protein
MRNPMDLDVFENMDKKELKKYIEFLLWYYRVMDAFWFIKIVEKYDQPTAESLNEQSEKRWPVWLPGIARRDLILIKVV